jgi:HK97 family phage portal protein
MASPFLSRVSSALAVLRGTSETRAVTPAMMPGGAIGAAAGMAGLSLVRTANPQEYKPDGATVRAQGFNKHPVVHACIRAIADIVASVPLIVLREQGEMETRVPLTHPLQRLLDAPGPRMTARQMRARLAVDYVGYGNAMFQLERPAPGRLPLAMRAINPESLQSVWVDAEGDPRRYDYGNWAGVIVQVPAEDVIHFRDLDMPRPYYPDVFGFPRGATAIASMTADNEATQYVRQVVTNDGTPTFAVLLSDEATQDDASAMQDRYRARVVDRGKRGTPAFFGSVRDIKPLGFTLSDLEFPDLRRVSREDICAAFGVDPRMIGIASATSDAGLSGTQYVEARARLVQHTIEPILGAIEDELNHWLSPEYGDVYIVYDHAVLSDLIENDTVTSERVQKEFGIGLRTWEESRRALKLSPVPIPTDTIALKTGTQLVPAAVAVIDPRAVLDPEPAEAEQLAGAGPGPMTTEAGAAAMDEAEAEQGQAQEQGRHVRTMADSALSGDQIEQMVELLESLAEGELPRDAVQAVMMAAFPAVPLSTIAAMLDAMVGFVPAEEEPEEPEAPEEEPEEPEEMAAPMWWERLTADELAAEPRYQQWTRAMEELTRREEPWYTAGVSRFAAEREQIGSLFGLGSRATKTTQEILDEIQRRIRQGFKPNGEYYDAWRAAFLDLIGEMYMVGARQVSGVGLSFSLQSPEVLNAISKRSGRLAELVGKTTSDNILSAIRAAELAGMSVKETGRLVQASVYNEVITDNRSRTIARTESAGAMSQGTWDQATQAGIYRSKEWLAFSDLKTRDSHTQCMEQGRIPFDDAFQNGLTYPLDPSSNDPAEVINCRCVLAPYITSVDEEPI